MWIFILNYVKTFSFFEYDRIITVDIMNIVPIYCSGAKETFSQMIDNNAAYKGSKDPSILASVGWIYLRLSK